MDGANTQITASWKVDYKYKRPDFLVRQLLKAGGTQTELGISDDTAARFGVEQATVQHPTDAVFSSHGRPFFEQDGIAAGQNLITDNRTAPNGCLPSIPGWQNTMNIRTSIHS